MRSAFQRSRPVPDFLSRPCTAFDGSRLLAAGPLAEVALAVKAALDGGAAGPLLAFDDETGRIIDLDLHGSKADIIARLSAQGGETARRTRPAPEASGKGDGKSAKASTGRGRPRLGVVAREVTLLPRHWDWLAAQPGGASAMLRRLVDEARRGSADTGRLRAAQERAFRFMTAIAGDFPGFEEAIRALFAGDRQRFEREMAGWPKDVRDHAARLAFDGDPVGVEGGSG
jgi:hypothetical protein